VSVKLTTRRWRCDVVDAVDVSLGRGASTFRDTIRDLASAGHKKILLNLGEVSYIDSSGSGKWSPVSPPWRIRSVVKLLNLTKRVKDLLQITKLTPFLRFSTTKLGGAQLRLSVDLNPVPSVV